MGFLSSIATGGAIGGVPGMITGGAIGSQAGSFGSTTQSAPEIDPRLKKIRDEQIKRAQDYRTNMKGMKEEQYSQAAEGSRQDLAGKLAGVTRGANSRGLLYSGLNQQARSDVTGDVASELASKRANINNTIEDQANSLDTQALGTSFGAQQAQQNLNDSTYQSNLARANMRQQYINNIMGVAGQGFGMAAGMK